MNRTVDVRALVSHIVRGDGVDRCRICMGETSQGQVFLEDTVMLDGERPVTLAELLETLTGLEVELSKTLPVGVCGTCATQALAAEKFLDLCKNSEHQWTLYSNCLDKLGSTDDRKGIYIISNGLAEPILLMDKKKPKKHKRDVINRIKVMQRFRKSNKKTTLNDRPLKNFPCPECKYIFNVRQRLNKHMRFMQKKCCRHCDTIVSFRDLEAHYHAHQLPVYHCRSCPEVFDCFQELDTHKKIHEGPVHACEECESTFMSTSALNSHMETHVLFPCQTCNKLFTTSNCFSKHKRHCKCKNELDESFKCPDCHSNFIDLEEFNRHILENGLKMCSYCSTTVPADYFVRHVKRHHDEILICPDCLEIFDCEEELDIHVKSHITETVKCKICNCVTTSKLTLLTHMKYLHSLTCGMCQHVFTSSDCHQQHVQICPSIIKMQQEYIDGVACPSCEQIFYSVSKLRAHLKESKLRICWVCQSIVPMQDMRHHMSFHEVAFRSCPDCGDIFLKDKKLFHHIDALHKPYDFKCIECHRTFESQIGLNMHFTTHGKNLCACGKKFDTRGCFTYHRLRCDQFAKAKAAVYICDYCKVEFKRKPSLSSHIALKHLNINKHICSTCGKRTNNYMHLLEHEATHKAIRTKYVCGICSLNMTSRRGYQKHMMRHSGAKYKCQHCDRTFPNHGQRTSHITRKHPETLKIFPCTICNKKYTKTYNLEKHMRDRHID